MFDRILGLPMHPLVVHGIVVLLPLMACVTILMAIRPKLRDRWGWWIVGANVAVLGLSVVVKESGEALLHRMAGLQIDDHEKLGSVLPLTALVLTGASVLVVLTTRYPRYRLAATVVTVLAAGLAIVWTVLTGHSGAQAVWGSQ
ncbi:MAG: hypothetical protein KBF43_04905 [Dermatophilaceae bacterium]|nr:hypothetical protein [Actinomycetales bacterium]MBP8880041.1 hypothetical protein [Dermatophilaceae bacterium]MBP9917907.1 hypothetical protein [Dermatophilaceae bacterium]